MLRKILPDTLTKHTGIEENCVQANTFIQIKIRVCYKQCFGLEQYIYKYI